MHFKAKLDFKHPKKEGGVHQFKEDNKDGYDSAEYSLDDDQVEEFYRLGWCDIDGRDPGPDAVAGAHTITVHSSVHKNFGVFK